MMFSINHDAELHRLRCAMAFEFTRLYFADIRLAHFRINCFCFVTVVSYGEMGN
jgi:hypothetical protein